MKKILILFLTIIFGTLLVGCKTQVAELKPCATREEVLKYTLLSKERKNQFINKTKEKITNTLKARVSIKRKSGTINTEEKQEIILDITYSKNPQLGFIEYKRFHIYTKKQETEYEMNATGNNYFEAENIFLDFKYLGKEFSPLSSLTIKGKAKIQFKGLHVYMLDTENFDFDTLLDKVTEIKVSPDEKLFVAFIDGNNVIFIDDNFNIKQIVRIIDDEELICNIEKLNVKVPTLTKEQKEEYKKGTFIIPGYSN